MSTTDAPFALGRRERRGAVLGWRAGQALAVALGALALVAGVGTDRAAGVVLGVLGAVAGVVVATVPVRGRGLDEWVPVLAAFAVRRRRGVLWAGATVVPGDGVPAHVRWPDGRTTVVAEVHHRGLRALADEPAAFAISLAGWLRGLSDPTRCTWTVTLLSASGPTSPPVDARWSHPGCAVREYVAVTSEQPVELADALGAAGVHGIEQLDLAALDELLGGRVAPAAGTILDSEFVARWSMLEGPATAHAAFVIEEWPAGHVDEQLLAPLCVARDRRTVAVSVTVEETRRARERAARLRTSASADRALTRAGGFLASAESARDDERDAQRATELASGHASIRVVTSVALDALDELELEGAAARLCADATSCGIRLRRCDGDHRRGVLASCAGWCAP